MENYNTTNIKDLPSVDQILDGDFLVVENPNGTSKIDFKDFVVGPNNTSFYTPLANDVLTLSGDVIENTTLVSSICSSTTTSLSAISSVVDSALKVFSSDNVYYSNKIADIQANVSPPSGRSVFIIPSILSVNNGNITVNYEGGGNPYNPILGRDIPFIFFNTRSDNSDGTATLTVIVSSLQTRNYDRSYAITLFGFVNAPSPLN